ncbi:MAG: hypothetical protein JWP07_4746 [Pseudonocardiales bacterium]|nr:hypothetical protein [Pseudonocardiales bacterium]
MKASLAALAVVLIGTCSLSTSPAAAAPARHAPADPATPIQHFVYMMQGDRSFDNYFGSYPGTDPAPADTCQKLVVTGPSKGCVKRFSLHGKAAQAPGAGTVEINNQYDGGRMDGFVAAYQAEGRDGATTMGYYDRRDLATYWGLADRYVLFDRFFSSTRDGERSNRSYWVAGSAPPLESPQALAAGYAKQMTIFDRLQASGVSWKFYVQGYDPKQNFHTVSKRNPSSQPLRVPLLNFPRFVDDPALSSHIVDLSQYYRDLDQGTLPAVAYVTSSGPSERSDHSIAGGQKLVTDLVGNLMLSKYWNSAAFLLSYDGSGGWYDHVTPPQVDRNGYGLRVPALLVSAYARKGYVDHTTMDYTSALAFIEQNWGLAPLAARDKAATSLVGAFDFSAAPRPAQVQFGHSVPGKAPTTSVAIVYWCYGVALLGVIGSVVFAFLWSGRGRRDAHGQPGMVEHAAMVGADS